MKKLTVLSPCFPEGGLIPVDCTGYGKDLSPQLVLEGLSREAASLAVILDDMGHPVPAYNHWTVWNLPAQPVIPGGIPAGERVEALGGAVQGRGYGKHRYRGPKPPFSWSHVYYFHVYALDCRLDLPPSARKRGLLAAMEGHILQEGLLTGHYR